MWFHLRSTQHGVVNSWCNLKLPSNWYSVMSIQQWKPSSKSTRYVLCFECSLLLHFVISYKPFLSWISAFVTLSLKSQKLICLFKSLCSYILALSVKNNLKSPFPLDLHISISHLLVLNVNFFLRWLIFHSYISFQYIRVDSWRVDCRKWHGLREEGIVIGIQSLWEGGA